MAEAGHLDALARAATVHLRPARDGGPPLWGSGFLVAPGWVLTCAHVLRPYLAGRRELVFQVRGEELNGGSPVEARLAHWLLADERADTVPVDEDLALVRLLDEGVEHECVWLTDRAERSFAGTAAVYGYRPGDSQAVPWDARAEVNVNDGRYGRRFEPTVEFPKGVSGGPVLDPGTGAVVGVVKSRRGDRDGGLAISVAALRRFGGAYQEVMAAHDRWHGDRPQHTPYNWADGQGTLPGAGPSPGGDLWTPRDRARALGLLAGLPAPRGEREVAALVAEARNEPPPPGRPPLLPTWRDGHGQLYGPGVGGPEEAIAFLHYLRLVELLVGGRGGDTTALGGWVRERLGSVRRIVQPVVSRAELPSAVNPSAVDPSGAPGDPDQGVVPYPGPGEGPTVVVELEPVLYEEPVRFYWRIRVEDEGAAHGGEPFEAEETGRGAAPEELVQRLRRPLAEAFQGVDTPDRPAPLEVALPVDHFDTAVHRWQLSEMARLWDAAHLPLGARRPVVLRDIARRGDPATWWERWDLAAQAKEFTAHRTPPRAGVPRQHQFTELPATAVPVLCRPAGRGLGRKALDMALEAGHGIVLWHTEGHTGGCQDTCETFHQGAAELLRRLGAADELPDRMRRIREQIYEGRDAGHWAEAVAVLYDDPRRPIPTAAAGTVDSP